MSWFNFFRKKQAKRKAHNSSKSLRILFDSLRNDTGSLQQQLQSLQETVSQHSTAIAEHSSALENHKARFAKLEQLVAQPAPLIDNRSQTGRIQSPLSESVQQQKYDISEFSPQQKRILQVFFEHQDMALSYNDLSQALGKSALTVKNQLHEIRLKADLFTKTIGADNRNRFKLKDSIKLQKYLNLG